MIWGKVRRWRIALLALAAAIACASGAQAQPQQHEWDGRYGLVRMLTFYVLNNTAADFTVSLSWFSQWQDVADTPVMVRVLDPSEHTIARHVDPGLRVGGAPPWNSFDVPVDANVPGVYQVIVTGLAEFVDFDISPELSWGVYGYPMLYGEDHLNNAYVFIPPNLNTLNVQCTGAVTSLRLIDGNGVTQMSLSGYNPSGQCALPAGSPNQVWRLEATGPNAFGVNFGVAPIIACRDQATALAIRASVDVLPDGTVCYHKFQVAAHQLLQQYRAMNPSAFAVSPPSLSANLPAWNAAPVRNSLLLGQYGIYSALPATLAEQNLNPASPWFGTIRIWHDSNGAPLPQNPWITYDRLGLTQAAPTINILAGVYSINDPINPLYHSPTLRNRIIIAALQEMMMLREHDLPEAEYTVYEGGATAFDFARFTRWFPWVIADCPSDVRAVLVEGMRRYVDHMLLTAVPHTGNQWSFIMLGLRNFAKGVNEPFYHEALERQINWLLTRRMHGYGVMPAGYIADGEGPDTSYSGIVLHNLGWLADDLNHTLLRKSLAASYYLLNHTIAPEPDGSWLGATSFAHRSPTDWTWPGWGGGVAMTGDNSRDAAAMIGRTWIPWPLALTRLEIHQAQQHMQSILNYHGTDAYDNPSIGLELLKDAPMTFFAAWEHFLTGPASGELPVDESHQFTRAFGGEFFCARRPSYYAFAYCGKTMEAWREPLAPTDPNVQYPRNGGGLSMFWSPQFGSSILAQNWSAYSTNSIIATLGNQTHFEDYWATQSNLQETLSRAAFNGQLTDGIMSFERTLNFLQDYIDCDIRLQTSQNLTYSNLWECFPYTLEKAQPIIVTLHDANGQQIPGSSGVASAIVFRTSSSNESHVIVFDAPRFCSIGEHICNDAYGQPRACGRVLAALPTQWSAFQPRNIGWQMRTVAAVNANRAIRQLTAN